ncbi:MAG: PAS domain S-box protein [Candidatus Thermoplasmatota archaeon]|nr:PAS domain S-box protein [Candidatus Thermoplasmatota archaeon]
MHLQPEIIDQLRQEELEGKLYEKTKKSRPDNLDNLTTLGIHDVLNLLADPVVIVNRQGKLLWINNAVETITHYTKDDLIGKNFFNIKLITAKGKTLLLKNLTKRMLGKTINPYVIEVLTKEGQKLYYEINATIISYQGAQADLVVLRDVNERKLAEKKIDNQQDKLRAILEHLQAGIVLIEASSHTIVDVNPFAAHLIGLPQEKIVGNICHKFICPSEVGKCPITDLKETVNNSRRILITASGEKKPILKTVSSVYLDGIKYIIDSFVDISEIEKTKEALEESEEKIRTITTSAKDAIIMMDNNGNISFWNQAANDIFGYTPEEALGKQLHRFLAPSHFYTAYTSGFTHFQQTGNGPAVGKTLELVALRKNGEEFPIELSLSSVKIKQQWHAIGIIRDICERKEAEKKLQQAKNESDYILNGAADGIRIVSLKKEIITMNDTLAKMVGVTKEQAQNLRCKDLFKSEFCETEQCALRKILKTGESFQEERIMQTQDGTHIPCLAMISPYKDKDGTIIGVIEDYRDITKIIETEQQLRFAEEHLKTLNEELEKKVQERTKDVEHLLKQKDEFINQLGHDLKTPLSPLINLIPFLAKDEQDPKRKELFEIILRNTDYMKNMVMKTIKLAQLNSTNMQLFFNETPLLPEINKILENNSEIFEQNSIIIHNHISPTIRVNIDKIHFNDLITNLISNSIKYTKGPGIIEISAEEKDNYVSITFKDSGIGMNSEQLENMFDEFYKADWSRHDFNSSGLGLSICKKIVELHGGYIYIESEGMGKGTIVNFTLPKYQIKNIT